MVGVKEVSSYTKLLEIDIILYEKILLVRRSTK